LKWDLHSNTFSINKDNPLQGDLLIIDEFSMVDNILLSKLLDASDNISQIIIVGDSDQLPSVGPGNVLHDLIDSDLINVIKLNKIYRQDEVSNIIKLAHHIKNSEDISEDFENDVTFYETTNVNIKNTILEYIKLANKKGYGQDDIQVVAPMYSGANGIDNINTMLQEFFNPRDEYKLELKHGSVIYREGDKILQLKNQNEDDVYNGDIGTLISIEDDPDNKSKKLIVDFDGNLVEYSKADLINIRHAYCISIHKSQGSEYPLIIAPFSYNYQKMLAKNLVYTAITRAKKKLVLVGDYNSFLYGVNNDRYQKRYTSLKERLIKSVNNI
jgi:exodeoxyribonuclease V alpha subunit